MHKSKSSTKKLKNKINGLNQKIEHLIKSHDNELIKLEDHSRMFDKIINTFAEQFKSFNSQVQKYNKLNVFSKIKFLLGF